MHQKVFLDDDSQEELQLFDTYSFELNGLLFNRVTICSRFEQSTHKNIRIRSKLEAIGIGPRHEIHIYFFLLFLFLFLFPGEGGKRKQVEPTQSLSPLGIQRERLGLAAAVMLQHLLFERGGKMLLGFATYRKQIKKARRCNKAMCIKRDDGHFSAATTLPGAKILADWPG